MKTLQRLSAALLLGFGLASAVHGETLDALREYGSAAGANDPNAAGIARGFTNPAADEYTITAGGLDHWGTADDGSALFDADLTRAAGENFSAIVRISSIGEPGEFIPQEWGRTGIMARVNIDAANSANVAHMRKSGRDNATGFTTMQWRDVTGGGTNRAGTEHGNGAANLANGTVDDTPLWVGLHRFDGIWYSTWADDVAGSPGTWSDSRQHNATTETAGEVWVGLAHQNHRGDGDPNAAGAMTSTATFDSFSVGAFDPALGVFPPAPGDVELTFSGLDVILSADGRDEIGSAVPVDVNWEVQLVGADVTGPGIRADIYLGDNSAANRNNLVGNTLGDPNGSTVIPNISWTDGGAPANGYPDEFPDIDNSIGQNLFANAVAGRFGGNTNNYGVHLVGEVFIPNDTDRDGVELVRFHDGTDDYAFLEIDGVQIINHNGWSSWDGTGNNGATQGTLDVSDPKYDDGEWVSIRSGMWEGGGGDRHVIVWDALDRTGSDSNTGATDGVLNSYNPTDLPDGNNVNFANDQSDVVPAENLRTPQPGLTSIGSGFGQPNAQVIGALQADSKEVRVLINGSLALVVPVLPTLDSASFTMRDEVTIVLTDVGTGGTRDVDETSLVIERNGAVIAPTVSKAGLETTIVDAFSPDPFTTYDYVITGSTTAGTGSIPISFSASVTSYAIPLELRAGLAAPPNATTGWDYQEFDVIATLGVGLGADNQMYRDALTVIRDAAMPLAAGTEPFVNHSDPDGSLVAGEWNPNRPILSDDVGVGDDQYVTLARTIITIGAGEEGDYTIRVRGDDGYGLRITGATFTGTAGSAINQIDPNDPSSAFFPDDSGNSNAFLQVNFPAPGDYLTEFFGFEGGGGSHQEIAWAPGTHSSINSTIQWELLGDTSGYVPESAWGATPQNLIDDMDLPTPPNSGWAGLFFYNATGNRDVGPMMNWLRNTADAANADFNGFLDPINHSDDNTGDQGFFTPDVVVERPDMSMGSGYPNDPTAGDTNDIKLFAYGRIVAPADGDYTIGVRSDDGFLFRFLDPSVQFHSANGAGVLHPSALNEFFFENGTGNSQTRAAVNLVAGEYDAMFMWWEGGGGSNVEVMAAPGVELNHAAPPFELLSGTPSQTNLYLGSNIPEPFQITSFAFDDITEELTLTFNSEDGVEYGIDFSSTAAVGSWGEATDANGTGTSTTVTILYSAIKSALGLLPADPLPDTVLCRVRDTRF